MFFGFVGEILCAVQHEMCEPVGEIVPACVTVIADHKVAAGVKVLVVWGFHVLPCMQDI